MDKHRAFAKMTIPPAAKFEPSGVLFYKAPSSAPKAQMTTTDCDRNHRMDKETLEESLGETTVLADRSNETANNSGHKGRHCCHAPINQPSWNSQDDNVARNNHSLEKTHRLKMVFEAAIGAMTSPVVQTARRHQQKSPPGGQPNTTTPLSRPLHLIIPPPV